MRRSREARPDDDFSSILSIDTAYRALWCEVLKQAWEDSTASMRGKQIDWRNQRAAQGWPRSRDFELVCSMAGMNPEMIANAFKSPNPDGPV